MERKYTQSELKKMADDFLVERGFTRGGMPKLSGELGKEQYRQTRFDDKMRTGAYCSGKARRKR
tara:strand:- start:472 stop:663 length:192 start_codon:yes stop_codon:yes gene_type:complete